MTAAPLSVLDNVRLNNGSEGVKNFYRDLLVKNSDKAMELINEQNLQFRTLFLLRGELSASAYRKLLNPAYERALQIMEELNGNRTVKAEKALRSGREDTAAVLKWMLHTGYAEDDADQEYGLLMDQTAALLTRSFHDSSVLPEIADLIFERHRNGRLIHELVWAFFEARNPSSLILIAQRLLSPNAEDVQLAKRLLCFIPSIMEDTAGTGSVLYLRAIQWLQENQPFLFYTGESLHLSNTPIHYAVSWVSKYLCRPVSPADGQPLLVLNEYERNLSSQFEKLSEQQQMQLADFSHMLFRRNSYQWNTWIRLPVHEQTVLASQVMGGLS